MGRGLCEVRRVSVGNTCRTTSTTAITTAASSSRRHRHLRRMQTRRGGGAGRVLAHTLGLEQPRQGRVFLHLVVLAVGSVAVAGRFRRNASSSSSSSSCCCIARSAPPVLLPQPCILDSRSQRGKGRGQQAVSATATPGTAALGNTAAAASVPVTAAGGALAKASASLLALRRRQPARAAPQLLALRPRPTRAGAPAARQRIRLEPAQPPLAAARLHVERPKLLQGKRIVDCLWRGIEGVKKT